MRHALLQYFTNHSRDSQFGGVAKHGTDMCSHAARSYWQLLLSQSRNTISGLPLFIDISGAFAAVITSCLSDWPYDDESFIHIIRQLELQPCFLKECVVKLASGMANVLGGVLRSRHVLDLVQKTLSNTWHTLQGCSEPTHAAMGTKPGGPLGGIFFSFLATHVLNKVEERRMQDGLTFMIPPAPRIFSPALYRDVCEAHLP